MRFTTVQWNIGGAKIRSESSDEAQVGSYTEEGLEYVIEKLKEYGADIVTFQESHADANSIQAQQITQSLGWNSFLNDRYDQSHIDPSQSLCQSVISRFDLSEHSFSLFHNPRFKKLMESGEEWTSHDKGITTCKADLGDSLLTIQTLHLIPFRVFSVDPTESGGKEIVASIEGLIDRSSSPYLLQGDFNFGSFSDLLPSIAPEVKEAGGNNPTTPKGRVYDHVLCRGLKVVDVRVDSIALTDHYPVITTFDYDPT